MMNSYGEYQQLSISAHPVLYTAGVCGIPLWGGVRQKPVGSLYGQLGVWRLWRGQEAER